MVNRGLASQHLGIIGANDEWATPKRIFQDACDKYMVRPTLDVAATAKNTKCTVFYDKESNGLLQPWNRDFFCNPPYSQVSKWVARAFDQCLQYGVTGMLLIYAKTDTKWWHRFIEDRAEVHFIRGRLEFIKPNSLKRDHAPYPSCWVIYR